jgi:predicted Zn-dependent protease
MAAGAGLASLGAGDLFAVEPHPTIPAYNTLSDEEEIALGRKFGAELEKEIQIVDHPLIDRYLNGIVADLTRASQRPNLPYHAKLINAYDMNAFSIPGGFMYVYRGLIQACDQEDELAVTLAHEIGHVVGRHATNQILLTIRARQLYDQFKENLLKNNQVIAEIIEKLGGPIAVLALLHFRREDEFEADMLGFYECLRANYQPKGYLKLFSKFERMERGSTIPAFLRDHPPAADRSARIRKELTAVQLPEKMEEDSFSFSAFKAAMNLLPEPPKKQPKH